jgi:NADPH2:quinone reductase
VGSAVLQLGQSLKARPIAVDRKPFDPAAFAGLELAGYVDTSQTPLGDAVRQLTNGKGVDVAFDCVGGELFEPVLSSLGQLGRHIAITSVGTRRVSFDLLNFYHRSLTLLGIDSRAPSPLQTPRSCLPQWRPTSKLAGCAHRPSPSAERWQTYASCTPS